MLRHGTPMLPAMWHALGQQLREPRGLAGRAVGRLLLPANRAPYALALDALETQPSDDVLEVGFGPGAGLAALARATAGRVAGLERSVAMMRMAARRNRAALAAGRMELRPGDAAALPWPDASFDRVLMVNVAYFFGPDGREIAEARRVLRPGGRLALYVTHRDTMRAWPFAASDTHRVFRTIELRALLLAGGFARDGIEVRRVVLARGVRGLVATAA